MECPLEGWSIVKSLGKGASGTVYEIKKDSEFAVGKNSALKVILIPPSEEDIEEGLEEYTKEDLSSMYEEQVQDISQEFKLLLRLEGKNNIVDIKDYEVKIQENGIGYAVLIRMELLTPLIKFYTSKKGLTEEQVINLGIDICNALELCEKEKIIHRDIKPQNIFVNDDGTYKLGDFGVARVSDHTMTATKTGTYDFMAPEVYRNQRYNEKVDQYGLGLVMYWCLNNRRGPFLPTDSKPPTYAQREEAREKRMTGEKLPRPLAGNEKLVEIILKACAYEADERYDSIKELKKELEALKEFTDRIETSNKEASEIQKKKEAESFSWKEESYAEEHDDDDETVGIRRDRDTSAQKIKENQNSQANKEAINSEAKSVRKTQEWESNTGYRLTGVLKRNKWIVLIVFMVICVIVGAFSLYRSGDKDRLIEISQDEPEKPEIIDSNENEHIVITEKITEITDDADTELLEEEEINIEGGIGTALESLNIRLEPDVASNIVGQLAQGDTVHIVSDTVTESEYAVWYEIVTEGDTTGYVRGDFLTDIKGNIPHKNTPYSDYAIALLKEQNKKSKGGIGTALESVNIRLEPDVQSFKVGQLAQGDIVSIISSARDREGETWFEIAIEGDLTGYVRSDFLTEVNGDIPRKCLVGDNRRSTFLMSTSGTTLDTTIVREYPSTPSEVGPQVAEIPAGSSVSIIGEVYGYYDGKRWYRISYDGIIGYILVDDEYEHVKVDELPVKDIHNARIGDVVEYGHYEQDNDYNNGQESIEWIVIDYDFEHGRKLLISKYALDAKRFHENSDDVVEEDVSWENCTLRRWLNEEFKDAAFSVEEQTNIAEVNIISDHNKENEVTTKDSIFLLSKDDIHRYFSSDCSSGVYLTEYACKDWVDEDTGEYRIPWAFSIYDPTYGIRGKMIADWILRDACRSASRPWAKSDSDFREGCGVPVFPGQNLGDLWAVRPALWVND